MLVNNQQWEHKNIKMKKTLFCITINGNIKTHIWQLLKKCLLTFYEFYFYDAKFEIALQPFHVSTY